MAMQRIINIADLVDPDDPQGRTYRQINAAKVHAIPIGALIEINGTGEEPEHFDDPNCEDYRGVRLYVVYHARDCDQTPLYCLAANRRDTELKEQNFYNCTWVHGLPEEALDVIALPAR